jgi:hypothetical protein
MLSCDVYIYIYMYIYVYADTLEIFAARNLTVH